MIKTLRNAWKLPELRNKILFVIFALLIFRLGAAIPEQKRQFLRRLADADHGPAVL